MVTGQMMGISKGVLMSSDLLLSQVLEGFYLARRADGYSPGTIQQYDWALSRWLNFLSDKPMRHVSIEDARRFIVYLQTDYGRLSPTSIFHAWKAIRALYKWASAEMSMPNIAAGLKPPKYQPPEIVPSPMSKLKNCCKPPSQWSIKTKRGNTSARPSKGSATAP
jgi:site-specific recombinase XerD